MALTEKQLEEEKKIEEKSTKFVREVIKKTQEFYSHPDPMAALDTFYSENDKLMGYEDFEDFLDKLDHKQLRLFFKLFVNQLHQATYHIDEKSVQSYLEF